MRMNLFSKSNKKFEIIPCLLSFLAPLIFTIHLESLLTWLVGVLSFGKSLLSQEDKTKNNPAIDSLKSTILGKRYNT